MRFISHDFTSVRFTVVSSPVAHRSVEVVQWMGANDGPAKLAEALDSLDREAHPGYTISRQAERAAIMQCAAQHFADFNHGHLGLRVECDKLTTLAPDMPDVPPEPEQLELPVEEASPEPAVVVEEAQSVVEEAAPLEPEIPAEPPPIFPPVQVDDEINGNLELPENSDEERYYVVTTSDESMGISAAVVGQIAHDDGSGEGRVRLLETEDGRTILPMDLMVGAVTLHPGVIYRWSARRSEWTEIPETPIDDLIAQSETDADTEPAPTTYEVATEQEGDSP